MLDRDPGPALITLAAAQFVLPAHVAGRDRRRFQHAVTRDTIYRRLSRRRRMALHARALAALTAQGAPVEDLARHAEIAGPDGVAADLLESSGRRAQATFQNATAARWFARARACLVRDDASTDALLRVDEERVDCLRLAGLSDDAIATLDDAGALTDDAVVQARLERLRAAVLRGAGRVEECGEALDRADVALVQAGGGSANDRCAVAVERGWQLYFAGRVAELDMWEASTLPEITQHGTPDQLAAYQQVRSLAALRKRRFRPDGATVDLTREALLSAERVGDGFTVASAAFNLAFALLWCGDLDPADAQLTHALDAASRCDDVPMKLRALTYRAVLSRLRGDVAGCREGVAIALDAAEKGGMHQYVAVALACRGWCDLRTGDRDAARADIDAAVATYRRPGPSFPFEWLGRWPAIVLALDDGDLAGVEEHAAAMRSPTQQAPPPELDAALRLADADALRDALPAARSLGYA
jgi:tetratricopeptide (TPR) repeat protein